MPAKTIGAAPRMKAPRPRVTMITEINGPPTSRRRTSRLKRRATATEPAHAKPMAEASPSPSRMQKNRVEGTYVRVPRRGEGRDRAPLAAGGRLVTPAKPLAGSCGSLRQVANSDQVVRRQAEDEHPAHSRAAAMSGLAQQPDGLEPAEDFLHALALALAHAVAGVARGAPIDRTRPARDVLGHVR